MLLNTLKKRLLESFWSQRESYASKDRADHPALLNISKIALWVFIKRRKRGRGEEYATTAVLIQAKLCLPRISSPRSCSPGIMTVPAQFLPLCDWVEPTKRKELLCPTPFPSWNQENHHHICHCSTTIPIPVLLLLLNLTLLLVQTPLSSCSCSC